MEPSGEGPIALIMAPTRELVQQICKEVRVPACGAALLGPVPRRLLRCHCSAVQCSVQCYAQQAYAVLNCWEGICCAELLGRRMLC